MIIYSDSEIVAINKPSGLLTVPGRGADKQDCAYSRLLNSYENALIVHRLDMDTSGVLLFARSTEAQRNLSAQFEKRMVKKRYIALVDGEIFENEGCIDFPIRKDLTQKLPPKHLVDCVRGKKAITNWRVLEKSSASTRVELIPQTGRSHQLRVHMQSIGHPIVGDPIYGKESSRLMLHAEMISFQHPKKEIQITLECPAPF